MGSHRRRAAMQGLTLLLCSTLATASIVPSRRANLVGEEVTKAAFSQRILYALSPILLPPPEAPLVLPPPVEEERRKWLQGEVGEDRIGEQLPMPEWQKLGSAFYYAVQEEEVGGAEVKEDVLPSLAKGVRYPGPGEDVLPELGIGQKYAGPLDTEVPK